MNEQIDAELQHFGPTVQDMERAYAFYTEVLGGTEVMRDGDFQGERIHNTLLTDQEIEARARQVNPRSIDICFHIRDEADFNQFIADPEAESMRRGMTQALGPVKRTFDDALAARQRLTAASR